MSCMGFGQQNTRQVAADQPLLGDKGGFASVYVIHIRVPAALKPFLQQVIDSFHSQ